MGQIKKIKEFYYIKLYIIINLHDDVPLLSYLKQFLFWDYLTFSSIVTYQIQEVAGELFEN